MEEQSVRILLAEYDRLGKLYVSVRESSRHVVQLYFALITAAVAALVAFQKPAAPSVPREVVLFMVLIVLFVLGLLSFMWLLSLEAWRSKIFRGLHEIRQHFISADPTIVNTFLEDFDLLARTYDSWSSKKGVSSRAYRQPGDKTPVATLNCLLAGILVWYLCHSPLLAIVGAGLCGYIHIWFTSFWYRKQRSLFLWPRPSEPSTSKSLGHAEERDEQHRQQEPGDGL